MVLMALSLAVLGLAACGGSGGGIPGNAVAMVGKTPITYASLNHWAATFVRGDYYQVTQKRAPAGLASDPPNYAACVSAAETIAVKPPKPTPTQLQGKCHQLYEAVKLEALRYLISALWSADQSAELGHKITETDINERIAQLQKEDYPQPGAFEAYLTNKGWSRADLHYIVKRNLLSGEVLKDIEKQAGKGHAGEKALTRLLQSSASKWTARTTCRPKYVVLQCKEYKGVAPTGPSPAVLFEQMAGTH